MGAPKNKNLAWILLSKVADSKIAAALLDDKRIGVLGFDINLADIGDDLEGARIEFTRDFDMRRAVADLGYNLDGRDIRPDLNINFSDEDGNVELLQHINRALNEAIKGVKARLVGPNILKVDGAVEGLKHDGFKVDPGHRFGNDIHVGTFDEGFEGFKLAGEGDVDDQLDAFSTNSAGGRANIEFVDTLILVFVKNDLDPRGKLLIGNEDRDRDGDFVDVCGLVKEDLAMVRVSPLLDHKRAKIRRGEGKLRGPIPGNEILEVA